MCVKFTTFILKLTRHLENIFNVSITFIVMRFYEAVDGLTIA